MLRAVLTTDECSLLFTPRQGTFLGNMFPNSLCGDGEEKDFSVLAIATGETNDDWRLGFYRFDVDLEDLNKRVLGFSK